MTVARNYYRCLSKSKKNAKRDGDDDVRNRLTDKEEKTKETITERDNE